MKSICSQLSRYLLTLAVIIKFIYPSAGLVYAQETTGGATNSLINDVPAAPSTTLPAAPATPNGPWQAAQGCVSVAQALEAACIQAVNGVVSAPIPSAAQIAALGAPPPDNVNAPGTLATALNQCRTQAAPLNAVIVNCNPTTCFTKCSAALNVANGASATSPNSSQIINTIQNIKNACNPKDSSARYEQIILNATSTQSSVTACVSQVQTQCQNLSSINSSVSCAFSTAQATPGAVDGSKTPGAATPTTPNPKESDSWLDRNWGYLAAGAGVLAVGGLAWWALSGSDSSPSPSPSLLLGYNGLTTNGFTTTSVDCTQQINFTNSSCESTYVGTCQTNENATNCQLFADTYCGLGNGTDAGQGVVPNGAAPGTGSTYCSAVEAWRYCQTPGRTQCPSCIINNAEQNPTCAANPTVCVGTFTQTQLASLESQCPGDPYYNTNAVTVNGTTTTTTSTTPTTVINGVPQAAAALNPQLAAATTTTTGTSLPSWTVPAAAGGAATTTDKFGVATNETGVGTPKAAAALKAEAAATLSAETTSTGGSGGSGSSANSNSSEFSTQPAAKRTVASLLKPYLGAASEVAPSLSQNVFQKASSATQMWCKATLCDQAITR